jgi:hypothetical protein
MPHIEHPEHPHQVGPIHDRIGPIFDWAYLKNLPVEIIQEITLIRAKAQVASMKAELDAAQQIVKVIEKAPLAR